MARREDFSINTIIGVNTSVSGDIETGGFTRVDGNVRGKVTVKGRVVVGKAARMKGNVSGTAITIGGVVYGDVLASEGLVILSTALIMGDIITRRIQADEGCLIHGKVVVCPTEESWTRAVSEYRDAQGVKSALSSFARGEPRTEDPALLRGPVGAPGSYGQD
ncbi:cell shape determination protein CcmA [Spirochaetia bacterium]|nr:cell shape determination protein CcmA [Spirochaetia bacterium]